MEQETIPMEIFKTKVEGYNRMTEQLKAHILELTKEDKMLSEKIDSLFSYYIEFMFNQ